MAEDKDGPAIGQDGPQPSQGSRDGDQTGISGTAAVKGGKASPGEREETSTADDCEAIDLDFARDRAS